MNLSQLSYMTDHLTVLGQKRAINAYFRKLDESNLWPVNNKFNATERAIRRLQKMDSTLSGFEYTMCLNDEISRIVNSEQ